MKKTIYFQHGYLLPTVMVIVLVLSALSFSSLSNSLLEMRMSQSWQESDRLFYSAESVLEWVEKKVAESIIVDECMLPFLSANGYINQNEDWWLSKKSCALSINNLQTRYVIEKLQADACVHVENNIVQGAEYFRITVWVMDDVSTAKRILQTTFAIAAKTPGVSDENNCIQVREISAGRQSWRYG